jgi:hypothetical protein
MPNYKVNDVKLLFDIIDFFVFRELENILAQIDLFTLCMNLILWKSILAAVSFNES